MTTDSEPAQNGNAQSHEAESPKADLDAIAGISEEEQQAIVAQINGIAESNRRSLVAFDGAERQAGERARKTGRAFPLLVNLFAAIALVGGFFALASLQGEAEARAREGGWAFSTMERALIDAIRRETDALLAQTDIEIFALLYRLDGVEGQLREFAGMGELTLEEEAYEMRLLALRDEYRADLEAARQDRARILSEARAQESAVQAQRDSRVREEALGPPGAGAAARPEEIRDALDELSGLAEDWERAARLESAVAAFFESARRQIAYRRFYEAAGTVRALREFLGSADFAGPRDAHSRGAVFASAADSLEALLGEYRAAREALIEATSPQGPGFHVALQREIAELELRLGEAGSGAESYARIAGMLEAEAGHLREAYDALYGELAALLSSNEALRARADGLERRAEALETIIESLTNQLNQLRQAIR